MPRKRRTLAGRETHSDEPRWQPLIDLLMTDWMWMFWVELEDGRRLDAYKHYWTRCYVHLDGDGHAFVFTDDGRYREIEPLWLLDKVFEGLPELRGPDRSGPWLD